MNRRLLAWTVAGGAALAAAVALLFVGGARDPSDWSPVPPLPASEAPSTTATPVLPESPRPAPTSEAPTEAPVAEVPVRAAPEFHHVAGRVVDRDSMPLSGVRVRAAAIDSSGETEPASALTGEDGAFRLEGLGRGVLILTAKREGLQTVVLRDVRAGREDLEIVLRAPTGLEGRVLDAETGTPIPRFDVRVFGEGQAERWRLRRMPLSSRTFESDDGSFAFPDLDEGRYDLEVLAKGYLPIRVGPFGVGDSEVLRGIEVRLPPGMIVRGTVVDAETGAPVGSAQVYQESGRAPFSHGATTVTEEDGIFEITCDSAGMRLRVRHDSYVDADTEPLGTKGMRSLEGLVIRLDRGGAIEGRALRTDGAPMTGATATPHPTRVPVARFFVSFPKNAETDDAGTFRIEGLAPGRYLVEVRPSDPDADEGGGRRLQAEAEVEAGKTTRVEFGDLAQAGSTVRGRVFRGEDPVRGASVQLSPGPSSRPPIPGRAIPRLWDQTGKDGSFEIPGAPPGEATLVVEKWETGLSEVGWWSITVPESGEPLFDAHLSGGEIRGSVVRASDRTPIRLAHLSVSRERVGGGGEPRGGWATTDGEGRFRVRGLEAGSYRVTAEPTALVFGEDPRDPRVASLAPQSRTSVDVGPDAVVTVDFALEPGGTAIVRVTDPSGAPMQGESVFVRPFELESRGSFVFNPAGSDGAGVARVEGLAPGRYVAWLLNPRYLSQHSEPGEVRVGQVTEFRLALREAAQVHVSVTGPEGTPLLDARVSLEGKAGAREAGWFLEGVREGEWVAYLVPGEYVLRVEAEGYATKSTDVQVESAIPKEIAVRLEREPPPR